MLKIELASAQSLDFKAFDCSYLFYFYKKNDFQEFAIHKNNLTTNNDKEYYIYINYVTGHGYDTFNQTFIHTILLFLYIMIVKCE